MPSAEHETPIALVQRDPEVVAWLLSEVAGVPLPAHASVRPHPTEARITVPSTYHADAVLVLCDEADRPVLAVVLEVQRAWDPGKLRSWRIYLAHVEMELEVSAALLLYIPRRPLAERHPAVAVLGALAHGSEAEIDDVFPALAAALDSLGETDRISYYDIVLAGLPAGARSRWEDFMTATTQRWYSEKFRKMEADALAAGAAQGKSQDVLLVLAAREITVPADVRDKVLATTDTDLLERWLRRAATAATLDEVFAS
ncbi:hypothetical protein [Nocardioides humi]|uniref:Uncharacterized protein n=1 Tax=Nocardioides humi TaxID=449461 RepID=A0ABN2AU54_9ACTN|nr:hypothetical protein [Nocardioides humi]